MALLVVFLLSVVVVGVTARAGGAPAEACDTLTPQHSPNSPQTSAVPYVIDLEQFSDESGNLLYSPGQTYTCEFTCTLCIYCLGKGSAHINVGQL